MGTLTYIGPDEVDVPLLRRSVKPGDQINDVDDALLTDPSRCWPAASWQVNGQPHEHDENAAPAATDAPAAPAPAEEPPTPEPAHAATEEK